ncbi:MAG: hypothetical protein J6Y75_08210 [Spirochaetaceae bacterium]|nr:hypothetical protein [Spirochaetaceae bacterium]
MKKVVLMILIVFISLSIYAKGYRDVTLTLNHSRRIDNRITIQFEEKEISIKITITNVYDEIVKTENRECDQAFFDTLFDDLTNLSIVDIVTPTIPVVGGDGYTVSITFGPPGSSVCLSAWSPDMKTEQRKLTEYYEIVKRIFEYVEMTDWIS